MFSSTGHPPFTVRYYRNESVSLSRTAFILVESESVFPAQEKSVILVKQDSGPTSRDAASAAIGSATVEIGVKFSFTEFKTETG